MLVTATELITPQLASEYLSRNSCNRPISRSSVIRFRRTIEAGEFQHTHQGIAFDLNGNLADGQHRLKAIEESGVPQVMQVTRGVTGKAKSVVDVEMRPRSVSDSLIMDGIEGADKTNVAIARLWMHMTGNYQPARFEIRDFLSLHHESIKWAIASARGHTITKHACVLTMLALGCEAGHRDTLEEWSEVVRTGVCKRDWHSSAIRFRDYWMTTKHGGGSTQRVEYCLRIYASMLAWIECRGLSKLYAKERIDWLGPQAVDRKAVKAESISRN